MVKDLTRVAAFAPLVSLACALSWYFPGLSVLPATRPRKMKRLIFAVPAIVNVPSVLAFTLPFLGRITVNVVRAAADSVNCTRVPRLTLRAAAGGFPVAAPRGSSRNALGDSFRALSVSVGVGVGVGVGFRLGGQTE